MNTRHSINKGPSQKVDVRHNNILTFENHGQFHPALDTYQVQIRLTQSLDKSLIHDVIIQTDNCSTVVDIL